MAKVYAVTLRARVPAGDEGDPLHDHDGEEEPGVARVLKVLPVLIGPLLLQVLKSISWITSND